MIDDPSMRTELRNTGRPLPKSDGIKLKKSVIETAILLLLKEGHDVGSVATVQVFETKDKDLTGANWMVEVYDPLDDDGTSLHNDEEFMAFVNENLTRRKDIGYKNFKTPEEAVDFYLFVVERMGE